MAFYLSHVCDNAVRFVRSITLTTNSQTLTCTVKGLGQQRKGPTDLLRATFFLTELCDGLT